MLLQPQRPFAGSKKLFSKMATFGWSYKSNVSGVKRPKEVKRNVEDWQKDREDVKIPLHRQSHSAESVGAGMKRRRCELEDCQYFLASFCDFKL